MSQTIDLNSVQAFFKWAEIEEDGIVEWHAINLQKGPGYGVTGRGRDNLEAMFDSPSFTDCLWCVGINPRPDKLFKGSAHDKDIQIYKNIYIDIEPIHEKNTNVTEEELQKCEDFVNYVLSCEILRKLNLVIAKSGNGFHLCIAIPSYNKPQEFGNKLQMWYKTQLLPGSSQQRSYYNCRIDSTFSPSRQVKLYGTRKPIEGSRLSSFPNTPRIESTDFRDFILSFPEKEKTTIAVGIDLRGIGTNLTVEKIEEKYGLRNGNL